MTNLVRIHRANENIYIMYKAVLKSKYHLRSIRPRTKSYFCAMFWIPFQKGNVNLSAPL